MTSDPDLPTPGATALLSELCDRMRTDLGAGVFEPDPDGMGFSLTPREGACPVYLMRWGDALILGIGGGGCRWELSFTEDDVRFVSDVVEAAASGRVREVAGPARSEVTLWTRDGTELRTAQADAPLGCLPVPRWRANRRRSTSYLPY